MKRLLISFLVLALMFCLGGYGGVCWYQHVSVGNRGPVATDNRVVNFDPPFGSSFTEPTRSQLVSNSVVMQESGFDSLPNFSAETAPQAIPVSDRFARPELAQPVAPPRARIRSIGREGGQQTFERQPSPQQFNEPLGQPTFSSESNWAQNEPFPPNMPPVSPSNATANAVDLMAGMSYLIRVNRDNESPKQKIQMERLYGGKRTLVLDLAEQHSMPELRIFAQAVEVNTEEGEFRLTCKGKVAVIANQSMIRGEGLELEGGVFKITEAEVVTPDAVIKSGNCEFEFAVGGISVDRIADKENVEQENAEPDDADNNAEAAVPTIREGSSGDFPVADLSPNATPWTRSESNDAEELVKPEIASPEHVSGSAL